jgi:drug/metabolite transporter, DME family
MGVLFAAFSALGYGASMSFTQMGLKSGKTPVLRGMMVGLLAANASLWAALLVSLLFHPMTFAWGGVAFFVAAGLMAPLLGRTANFMAIQRLGASRGASLVLSENLFAGPLALLLFAQTLSLVTVMGIVVIVVGMVLFINEIRQTVPMPVPMSVPVEGECAPVEGQRALAGARNGSRGLSRSGIGVVLGLAAGLFFASANLFRQAGVDAIPSALLGSAIGTAAALLVTGLAVVRARQVHTCLQMSRHDAFHFALSGLTSSVGMLAIFWALDHGSTVAAATAIKNTAPLFTFALAALFLSRLERITVRLGLLIALVVSGAVLTTLGRLF